MARLVASVIIFLLLTSCALMHSTPPELRESIVAVAKCYIEVPYEWGGQSFWWQEGASVDCSGFVINVYKEALQDSGWSLGFDDTTADGLFRQYTRPTDNPLPGDLVFFSGEDGRMVHVAIYLAREGEELVIIDASSLPETSRVLVRCIPCDRRDLAGFAVMRLTRK